mgnify:FL=1|tara:strand:- start:132 stop:779 length:648 start_codon:yes stop_codon:yes gene_type:complete
MANVGDLFINVRAKTSGLTKGLRSARRSLANFARSGTAIIAGIGAAFGVFKLFDFLMGSLIGHSKEFREAWAKIGTEIAGLGADFAKEFGPALAKGISDLAEWLATSEAIRDTFRGMGEALDFLSPIFDGLSESFMWWQKQIEKFMNWLAGSEEIMAKAGQAISPEELRALSIPRSGPAAEARALGAQKATSRDYLNAEMLKYQKRIAERVEIPK